MNELQKLKKDLEAQRDQVLAKSAPLHAKRDALLAQLQPLEAELQKLNKEIKAIEQPEVLRLGKQIAALARALGAKSIEADPAQPPKKAES